MTDQVVLRVSPAGFPWQTSDPFLFCVYHQDTYPAGNEHQGPAASLAGRHLGQDFDGKDGWRMYHGEEIPGFPGHPHRGFETVTVVRQGAIDHSDSLGATARFADGDVQWLTAGAGIVHAEMFPLRNQSEPNPLELFQIWLNLPSESKLVSPYFSMFWREQLPNYRVQDSNGRPIEIEVVAGALEGHTPPTPPPDSWASRASSELAIWIIKLAPHAEWTLPAASAGVNRSLYPFVGTGLSIGGTPAELHTRVQLRPELPAPLINGASASQLLLLQGRPIGEPVAHQGPFVMNTQAELQQAYADYRRTQFGGWPWGDSAPVHARDEGRFARYPDGKVERP